MWASRGEGRTPGRNGDRSRRFHGFVAYFLLCIEIEEFAILGNDDVVVVDVIAVRAVMLAAEKHEIAFIMGVGFGIVFVVVPHIICLMSTNVTFDIEEIVFFYHFVDF
jgi:hypothetical protein